MIKKWILPSLLSVIYASEPAHNYEIIIDVYNPTKFNKTFSAKAFSCIWGYDNNLTANYDTLFNITTSS